MIALVRRLALTIMLTALAAQGATAAEKLTPRQEENAQVWAANNSLFTLYHEVTHLLIDQLNLPVLGREEDAADAMASYRMLIQHTHEADVAIADAAYGWLLLDRVEGGHLRDSDFYNEHSLDKQRAFQIVCYMVGSNAKSFRKVADRFHLSSDRQDTCSYDWARLKVSIDGLLAPTQTKNHKPTKISITYETAPKKLRQAAEAFKKSGVFEQVAHEVERDYSINHTVKFVAKSCGEPNAFYDQEKIEIIYCYELMDDFVNMISKDMPKENALPPASKEAGLGRAIASGI
ncbi:MAG TPA: DUF4344 domain-containing metallopeptidase [Devosiaceae bacterium]|jgi:hypothetical protein